MDGILRLLEALEPVWFDIRLVRCVERDALESRCLPEFLHTSGKSNRYNPAGVECVYFSENLEIAAMKYNRYQKSAGLPAVPFTTYFADASLPVLDLGDPETCKMLGPTQADLHVSWRLSKTPVKTQNLGVAVARQERFVAIRYPSDAAPPSNKAVFNFAIFHDNVANPATLTVLTGQLLEVQRWP